MPLTITASSSAASAAATSQWSVNSMAQQILGELNQDRNTDADAPDRLTNIVVEALREVWDDHDWAFQLREGTFTIAADDTSKALADDFGEMHSWIVTDVDEGVVFRFTKNARRWKEHASGIDSSESGHPRLGLIIRDVSDTDDFAWIVKFEITSDRAYSWPYMYKALCPIDLDSGHDDYKGESDALVMPKHMHRLWHLNALWHCQRAFKSGKDWKDTKTMYDAGLTRAIEEMDEPHTDLLEPGMDGYQDLDAVVSIAGRGYGEGDRRLAGT